MVVFAEAMGNAIKVLDLPVVSDAPSIPIININKPSEHGTTEEIAEKLGISKKAVRKLKQTPGLLDEKMAELS